MDLSQRNHEPTKRNSPCTEKDHLYSEILHGFRPKCNGYRQINGQRMNQSFEERPLFYMPPTWTCHKGLFKQRYQEQFKQEQIPERQKDRNKHLRHDPITLQ